jgi:predicted Rossmann fold flavoprotein
MRAPLRLARTCLAPPPPLPRSRRGAARLCFAAAAPHAAAEPREVLVVGGGAAGLTAAIFAAGAGARVTVLERNGECGKKILASGGTRANVLPLSVDFDGDFFTGSNRGALRRLLASWPLPEVLTWLRDDVGIALSLEEETQKWFPAANSGRAVRDALLAAATARGVAVRHRASVERVARAPDGVRWEVRTADGGTHAAHALVLATGGLSFPALGTDGTGHRIVSQCLGHALHAPYPALVPLHGAHPGAEGGAALAGVSLQSVALRAGEGTKAHAAHRGGFLFTHRGFSGPAVLDLSHRHVLAARDAQAAAKAAAPPPQPLRLYADWTGEGRAAWEARLGAGGAALVSTRVAAHIPTRLAAALCAAAGVPPERKAAELRRDERQRLLDALTSYALPVTGDGGYTKAEVTGGGVPLHELRGDTLESRKAPGVFLCGELVDAFGRIGGFNFLMAWCTGRLAGLGAAAQPGAPAAGGKRAKQAAVAD